MIKSLRLAVVVNLAALGSMVVLAQGQPASSNKDTVQTPYELIQRPFAGDARTVYFFFDPTCPYSAQYHASYVAWGRTLIAPWKFEAIPIIANKAHATWAMAYYAGLMASPEKSEALTGALYVQGQMSAFDPATGVREALRATGIAYAAVQRASKQPQFAKLLESALDRNQRADLTYSPTIVIAGKYKIHAELTGGDYGLLMQLANGLVSMLAQGQQP